MVVDDGSSPAAAVVLDGLAESEPDVSVVRQQNAGLTAARILGAASARGSWLAFLDDDDRLLPGWSELASGIADDVAIVSGAARLHRPDGSMIRDDPPRPLGPIFGGVTAQYLAGSFVVRRDVYERAGGYLPGLSCSHQTELFIRCAAVCREQGLTVASTTTPVVRIERRNESDRVLSNPRLLYDGTRWILSRHATRFALDRVERSNWEGVAAVNAARLRDPMARSHAFRSVRDNPSNLRTWARLAAMATPLQRPLWRGAAVTQRLAESQRRPLQQAVSFDGTGAAALCARSDLLFLPWRYRENPPVSSDAGDRTYWSESGLQQRRAASGTRLPLGRAARSRPTPTGARRGMWCGREARPTGRTPRRRVVGCGSGQRHRSRLAAHAGRQLDRRRHHRGIDMGAPGDS
ncbi:MAG: glycosyltransferase family 2 protein [Microthrixaceae bacterium]|nr:glycosyltransferase family 2 protein [Microthrixaceae bacterium]